MNNESTGEIKLYKTCPAEDFPDSLDDVVLNKRSRSFKRGSIAAQRGRNEEVIDLNKDGFSLLESAKAGDETSIRILYDKLKEQYEIFVFKRGFGEDYEDIFHKAFRCLWKARIKSQHSFTAFFRTIMRNLIISEYNLRARYNQVVSDYEHELSNEYASQKGESWSQNPEKSMLREEGRITIVEAIESLKPEFRDVIKMHYYGGRKLEEIAVLTDVPIGTVKSRMFYAKRMLNDILRDYFYS